MDIGEDAQVAASEGLAQNVTSEVVLRGALQTHRLVGNSVLVAGSALLVNVFAYIFHFVLSRRLGPGPYGALATLLSIAALLGVIGSSIGTVAMQESSRLWSHHLERYASRFVRHTLPPVLVISVGTGLVVGAAGIALARYLNIADNRVWFLLALYVAGALVTAYARGVLQGIHRFGIYAASVMAEGTAKVCLALVLVAWGFGLIGTLVGLLGSALAGLAIALWAAVRGVPVTRLPHETGLSSSAASLDGRSVLASAGPQNAVEPGVSPATGLPETTGVPSSKNGGAVHTAAPPLGVLARRAGSIALTAAATSSLLYIDMLFARHHLTAVEAGLFAAAGTIARTIPYGAGLVMPVLSPLAAAAAQTSRPALRRVLALVGIAALGAAVLGVGVLWLFPHVIVRTTYGPLYVAGARLLHLYAVDEALFAVCVLGISYLLAVGEYRVFGFVVTAVCLEIVLMASLGTSASRLLGVAIAVNAALTPCVWLLALRTLGVSRPFPHPTSAPA
jgi:O-antigen/teichoic acid export membrane protein